MLDPLLRSFVEAPDHEEAEPQLEMLFSQHIDPLIRKIVARKLGAIGSRTLFQSEDLEDVAGDAALVLVKRLWELRGQPDADEIENLESYTAAAVFSVCAHHLRRRYPERSRLKNRLRYRLARDRRFALWDVPGAGLVCGLAHRRGEPADGEASAKLVAMERQPERWPPSWRPPALMERADPSPLVGEILILLSGPIALDGLVSLVAAVWKINRLRPAVQPGLLDNLATEGPSPELATDRRRFAERLWFEVQQLPVRQRVALLLNLRDGQGAGMLWIFPVTGIASMRAIAGTLELPVEELASLWQKLPLDDNTLSERLGCTRQQVINLRMSARKRLTHRLAMHDRSSGNLHRFSASQGEKA
jgi:hypothetical protein